MSISTTARKVIIHEGVLSAECLKADNTYGLSSISLDNLLGNVDGKFILGGKNFSQSAQEVGIVGGILYAKLLGPGNNYVDAKFDLQKLIINNGGVLTATLAGSLDTAKATAPALKTSLSTASSASAASASSGFSATSTTSSLATSISRSSSSYSKSSSTFHSSSFRSQSQQYLIEDSGSNFLLKDAFFHLDFIRSDGSVSHTSIDLDLYIGIVNGQLQWGATGFSKASNSFRLEGFFLVAEIPAPTQIGALNTLRYDYVTSRLDLRTHFRISGSGILIFLETNKKLSMMLSEVPWMKFKVIAEPDLSLFASHPVVKTTLSRIAESTVEHVTVEMHKMLTIAMEEAIVAITASAMKHVSLEMEHSVRDAVGFAAASPSVTEAEYLRIAAQGLYAGGGYKGGYAGGGYVSGGVSGAGGGYGSGGVSGAGGGYTSAGGGYTSGGGYVSGGYVSGGGGSVSVGGANGANGIVQVGSGGGGSVSAQNISASTDSYSASQSASRSESYSSESNASSSASTVQAQANLVSV